MTATKRAADNGSQSPQKKTKKGKVVLAYSGGLDTSCILAWLIDEVNYSFYSIIICFSPFLSHPLTHSPSHTRSL